MNGQITGIQFTADLLKEVRLLQPTSFIPMRFPCLSREGSDALDLDKDILGKTGNLDAGAGGKSATDALKKDIALRIEEKKIA